MQDEIARANPLSLIREDGTMLGISLVLGRGVSGSGHALCASVHGTGTKFGISGGQDFYAQYTRAVDHILMMRRVTPTMEERRTLYETRHALLAHHGITMRLVETLDFNEAKKRKK